METVSYADFAKLDIRTATVISCEKIEGTDKLLKLLVKIGDEEERTIVAGIAKSYSAEELVGKTIIVIANLETRKLKGVESQGMLLAAGEDVTALNLLTTDKTTVGGGVKIG